MDQHDRRRPTTEEARHAWGLYIADPYADDIGEPAYFKRIRGAFSGYDAWLTDLLKKVKATAWDQGRGSAHDPHASNPWR